MKKLQFLGAMMVLMSIGVGIARVSLFGLDWGVFDIGLGPWTYWDAAYGGLFGAGSVILIRSVR